LDFVHRSLFQKTTEHNVSETTSVSLLRYYLLCWVPLKILTSITPSKGINRVGVSPITWGRNQIKFPKRCVV
jgi:hypothetical protein